MRLLRKYQLDVIFLFFAFALIAEIFFYYISGFAIDPHNYEWYVMAPLIILYVVWLLKIRNKIKLSERRKPTGKSLVYWLALGIIIFANYETPLAAGAYWSLNIFFIVFTVMLADSYWDFKKITVNEVVK